MARQRKVAAVLAVVLLLAVAGRGLAEGVKVGDAAPKWSDIVGVDDKKHGLDEYAKAKLLVLVVTCNHCPVAVAYEDRLIELQKDYRKQRVRVVAVNVNNLDADKLEPMKKRAEEKKFNFPYLYDPTQKIGHDYGATVTPHVFVLDPARKVAYIGAVDDNNDPEKVKVKYLRDALDSLLKGEKPPKAETTARGCSVKYD